MAGTLLPVVLFAVGIVYELSNQEQTTAERRMLLAARNLALTVEDELSGSARTLQALAVSEQLYDDNLPGFYQEVQRLGKLQPQWLAIILLTPNGQQILRSDRPLGSPLSLTNEPASLQRLVKLPQPTIGNLAITQPGLNYAFPVRVPVMDAAALRYVLTATITPSALAQVINDQSPVDGEWTRTIVDGQGIVVARTRDPERFVGQRSTASFLQHIRTKDEGIYRDITLEGKRVYVAFSRVGNTAWTAAVTVPVGVIQSPVRQALGLTIGSGLVLLVVSGLGAFLLSRQISRSITAAARAAEALAKDEYPHIDPLTIREIGVLGQSLELAADLLAQRERERAENLRRAEAARAEAEAANRIKDEFLAVLSHELRTPLNPILGWAHLLQRGGLDRAQTAVALKTIERNARLQTQLIEDLLDVTRIMRGKLTLNQAQVSMGPIILAAIETVQLAADAKGITLCPELDTSVGPVRGDSVRLQQIIWNLLSNAIKFTDQGGQVTITLSQQQTQACIQVSDTGKGIHPDFLPHVFKYFRQEDGTITRKFGGLGLGLAIVHHLVELHGGSIRAESSGEGQGAIFTVWLPLL